MEGISPLEGLYLVPTKSADPSRVKAPVTLKRQSSPSPLRNSVGRFVPLPAACAPVLPAAAEEDQPATTAYENINLFGSAFDR